MVMTRLSHSFYTNIKENLAQAHTPIPQLEINMMFPEILKQDKSPLKKMIKPGDPLIPNLSATP